MVTCPWHILPHAVRRYIQRVRPGLAYREARRELEARCANAVFVEALETRSREEWRTRGKHRARLVVDPDWLVDGKPVVVTVLEVRRQ